MDGRAVAYALSLDFFQRPFAVFILSLGKNACTALGVVTWYWEAFGPLFLVMPFLSGIFVWLNVSLR